MRVGLPFKRGDRIIELGGDTTRPVFRPNVNCTAGEGVDIVADLNEPIPVGSGEYDGVYASYVLEHLRTKKVRGFISEVHRILKPNGVALLFAPNLREQARLLSVKKDWTDDDIMMLFGGNPDYPGNYHHTGFNPQTAVKLFLEAGFSKVTVLEHPVAATDMIIEAIK